MYISTIVNFNVSFERYLGWGECKGASSVQLPWDDFTFCTKSQGHSAGMVRDLHLSSHLIHATPPQPKPKETNKLELQRRKSRKLMSTEISPD